MLQSASCNGHCTELLRSPRRLGPWPWRAAVVTTELEPWLRFAASANSVSFSGTVAAPRVRMESGGKPATIDAGVLLALVVARSSGGFLLRIGVQRREVEDP